MNYKIFKSDEIPLLSGSSQAIAQITRNEANLTERSVKQVEFALRNGYFLLAIDQKKEILGWIETSPLWRKWWGMFSLYVYPEHRKKGLGCALLDRAFGVLKGKNIYAATSNPGLKKILLEHKCKKVKFSNLPIRLHLALVFKRYRSLKSIIKARKFFQKNFEYFLLENTQAK